MNVLMLSPGFPAEMPFFARGLAGTGAQVVGLGDQPPSALPQMARESLVDYWQIGSFSDAPAIIAEVRRRAAHVHIDQVESLWEPTMLLAAQLREQLGIAGLSVDQTIPFRDKEQMKRILDAAGIRTPHHYSATTAAGVHQAAEHIGFPLIVKPISGAGSADTYRVETQDELLAAMPLLRDVAEVSVEEFVDAEEFTLDTICAQGRILFENICWYRPRPLVSRQLEWISPMTVVLRDINVPDLAQGRTMGRRVLTALGFSSGFTHMEWYRKADGEVVFGEIAARPAGARTVDVMNFSADTDLFARWAEAVVHGSLGEPVERRYNAASVFKRAQGQGRIHRIEGLSRLMAECGEWVAALDLLPLGAARRDWHHSLISDGMVIIRHPDLAACLEISDRFASELQLYAA